MPLRRTALERNRRRLCVPAASPEDDIVVREVMPPLHLLYRRRLQLRIAPRQRPPLFLAGVPHALHPIGDALNLAIVVSRRQIVEQVVVRFEMTTRMTALIVIAHLRSRQWSRKHIAEIEHHLPAWRQAMRRVEMR